MIPSLPWRKAAAAIMALGMVSGCGGDSTTAPNSSAGGGTQIQALPTFSFSPTSVEVAVGATVTWVFGSVGHTVTFDTTAVGTPDNIGSVDAPNVNVSISRTFSTAGTYFFHCSIHPSMTGAVIVGSSGTVTPPPPPPPPPAGYLKTP